MAEKPRLLVIDREAAPGKSVADRLGESFEVVTVRSISKALSLLRDSQFAAVYVDASQLSAVRWVGMMIQAEEILDAISDGVAVVDPDLRIIWANPEFHSLTDSRAPRGRVQVLPGARPRPRSWGPTPARSPRRWPREGRRARR